MGYGGVAGWIMEALALESLGMPVGSSSLVIDGMPTPEISTQVFDVVQRDAAWQSAYERCIITPSSRSPESSWVNMRENDAYVMAGFPEALQQIVYGRSLVKCNFDIGFVHDVDEIVEQGRTWIERGWLDNWRATRQQQADIHTVAPLPGWLDLLREDMREDMVEEVDTDQSLLCAFITRASSGVASVNGSMLALVSLAIRSIN
jgi:hypothetical protein